MARAVLRRGFTLVEVIVGSVLSFLLLGLIIAFLVPSVRAQVRGTQQVELQERALMAFTTMARDLQRSGCAGLSLRNVNPTTGDSYPPSYTQDVPFIASIVEIRSVLGDTSLDWTDRPIAYWYDRPQGRLYRREWNTTPPALSVTLASSGPVRLPASDLLNLTTDTTGSLRELVREVVWFNLTHSDGDGRQPPPGPMLTLSMRVVRGDDVCRMTRQVLLRY